MATIMWFTNAFSTRRDITIRIPVTYTHVPDDYIFTTKPTDHVHVRLEDEGVDLFRNRDRHYELTIDLSPYISGENGSFIIPMDEVRQAIAQQLVGDAVLAAFTPEVLTGAYTRQHEKLVPVVFSGKIKPAAQHQLCSPVEFTPQHVRVYGTEERIASITQVETALTEYEGVQDTFLTRLPLIIPQDVRLVPDTVGMRIVAEQFTEKALQLSIHSPGLARSDQRLHLFPEQVTVTFRVGTSWFTAVTAKDFEAYVDLPQPSTDHLPVKVECSNPHVTYIRVRPEEVEYLIERYETHTDGGSAAAVSED